MTKTNNLYMLATGALAAKRLDLQDRLFSKSSHQHLAKAGLAKGKIICDIGCGSGIMTEYLAKEVGEAGHVYAMDISQKQLDVVEERIKACGLKNVTYILGDITERNNLPKAEADIIYSRFLLMHLKNPQVAIENMKSILKPKGVIVSQEPIWQTNQSSLHQEMFKDYVTSIIALGKYKGLDYSIGKRLKNLLEHVGFAKTEVNITAQKFPAKESKPLLALGLAEWAPSAIAAEILTQEKIDSWQEVISSINEEDESFYLTLEHAYALARK